MHLPGSVRALHLEAGEPKLLSGGSGTAARDYRLQIEAKELFNRKLERGQCLVAILTRSFYQSEQCLHELTAAFTHGLTVLPIVFEREGVEGQWDATFERLDSASSGSGEVKAELEQTLQDHGDRRPREARAEGGTRRPREAGGAARPTAAPPQRRASTARRRRG